MSSTISFLAYVLDRPEAHAQTEIRLKHAGQHLASRYATSLGCESVGDASSGIVMWLPTDSVVDWRPLSRHGDGATAWLHIPSAAGACGGASEIELASAVLGDTVHASAITPPFAVARWSEGVLEIVNDLIGAVRLYHYRFDGGDVWTTRMGLAHVFMGSPPERSTTAWSGMASIGWAPGGSTQLGRGRHLPGGSRVRAECGDRARSVAQENRFGEWFTSARHAPPDSAERQVKDMEDSMSIARRWPEPVIADLSGGKDSRLIASLGIKNGTIETVRTVATDHGEVETARALVALLERPVTHLVVEHPDLSAPRESFISRVSSHHEAWEGRFLASTAFGSVPFSGFRSARHATFNGLGGEVVAGGALWAGAWRERLLDAPAEAAITRLAALARNGLGASEDAKEETVETLRTHVEAASEVGVTRAGGILDLVYLRDRMPHWVNTFSGTAVVCPLFAPSLLRTGARSAGAPIEDGLYHRALIFEAIPAWATLPFYKPAGQARLARPRVWETGEWAAVRGYVRERVGVATSFDVAAVDGAFKSIEAGEASKAAEVMVHRLVWELTFEEYRARIADEARATAEELETAGAGTSGGFWGRLWPDRRG